LVFGGMTLLVSLAGAFLAIRYGSLRTAQKLPELPEIPAVNIDGADPAIAKLVREVHGTLEKSPRSGTLWGRYAMVLHAHGFSDAAHICYDAAARLDPKNPKWPYLEGCLHQIGPGGSEAALPYFERAVKLSAPDTLARVRLADALLELGRLDEAQQEYFAILSVQEQDPQAQLGLGRVAVARRQYREALRYLQAVSEHPRVKKTAWALLANVYNRLGDQASAVLARKRLAEMPPDVSRPDEPLKQLSQLEVGVHAELVKAQALMEQDRIPEMLALVEGTVHRYPYSFEAWDALSIACVMSEDPDGAERAAKKSIQLVPRNSGAWLGLGNILIWERRYQDALEPLQKSIELDPRNHKAYHALGKCRQELGDTAGAAEAFRLSGIEEGQSPESPSPVKKP
jgi:tetratricopeptide (TPR) repeat protein